MESSADQEWQPYEIAGTRHPGVFVKGMQTMRGELLIARIDPGGGTLPHMHSGEERITIIRGNGLLTRSGKVVAVSAGQIEIIPPDTIHALQNPTEEALEVTAAFSPGLQDQKTRFV